MDEFDRSIRAATNSRILWGDEILRIPDTSPLIDGVLDLDSTALLYGPTNIGKSFVALDWALCIATGITWQNHKVVQPGRVLYIVGEGLSGTRSRVEAWMEHHGIGAIPNMAWAKAAPNLLSKDGRDNLMEDVTISNPVLVVLDTVARHIPGGDENSFETISHVVEMLDWIRIATGGCGLAIGHTGKVADLGNRGHSSLKAAMDTEIYCKEGPTLLLTKQKNHEAGGIIGQFELKRVGKSAVLSDKSKPVNSNDDKIIKALTLANRPLSWGELHAASLELGVPPGSFDRSFKRLLAGAMVVRDGGDGDGTITLP